jgi:PRTRC genetic system protein D
MVGRTKKMTTATISIDVGSGYTQFTDGSKEDFYPSIVCPAPEERVFGIDNETEIVKIDNKKFIVGKDAYSYGDPDSRLSSLSSDWAGSQGWQALLYSAIAKCGVYDSVNLITGLPQTLYSEKGKELELFLSGTHKFVFDNVEHEVTINPRVIPQAAGALLYEAKQTPAILEDMVGVIDIGTYTTGFSVLDEKRFVASKCNGCSVGMSQLLSALQDHLLRERSYAVDPLILPRAIMKKQIKFNGEIIDISEDIAHQAMIVSKPMLDEINAAWKGANELTVYVAGGGAPYFYPAIKTIIPHAILMDDAFFAVVRGMHDYLLGSMSK